MMVLFGFISILLLSYRTNTVYLDAQNAADAIADGTAYDRANTNGDAETKAKEILQELNKNSQYTYTITRLEDKKDATAGTGKITVELTASVPSILGDSTFPTSIKRTASTEYQKSLTVSADGKARLAELFPSGVPTSAVAMEPYLTTISVPSTIHGTIPIRCHKQLAPIIQQCFQEMAAAGFPVKDAACYTWRSMASGTGHQSHHSYGVAIDINAGDNPAAYWGYSPNPSSPYYINQQIVNIWKSHGFFWGGDWSPSYRDPMHFTWTNH